MSKKGFTLVELLAAIAVLSLLMGIAVVSYAGVVENSRIKAFKAYENTMHAQAMHIMIESLTDSSKAHFFPSNGETKRLTLEDLEIETFVNPKNKNDTCSTSYVDVTRNVVGNVDSFTYKVCLICTNSDYNVSGTDCEIFEN